MALPYNCVKVLGPVLSCRYNEIVHVGDTKNTALRRVLEIKRRLKKVKFINQCL
jgi:hypothetical protein